MKCDRGADAWNKFEEITHQCFLTSLGRHVPLKINMGFAKVWRKNFFLAKMAFFTCKNLEQPSYTDIAIPVIVVVKWYTSQWFQLFCMILSFLKPKMGGK